jgi:hypothetical protein
MNDYRHFLTNIIIQQIDPNRITIIKIIHSIITQNDPTKSFKKNLNLLKHTPIWNNYHNYNHKRYDKIIFINKKELLEKSLKMNVNPLKIDYLSDMYFQGNINDCIDAMNDYIYNPSTEEVLINIIRLERLKKFKK